MTRCLLVLVVLGGGACRSVPEPPRSTAQSAPQPIKEELIGIPMGTDPEDGQPMLLQATLYRPEREGRVPLAIVNHGSPPTRDADKRRGMGRFHYLEISRWFVKHGFAVVVPMRRGYAGSDGDYAEDIGTCQAPDYKHAAQETARDISAAVEHLSRAEFVEPGHIVVVGASGGGLGALAFAAAPGTPVSAVINFSGGRGGRDPDGSGRRCAPERLVEAAALFGSKARIPSLWLYSENDTWFPPDLARSMSEAFRSGGAPSELVVVSPVEDEGHKLATSPRGVPLWSVPVARFLQGLGYSVQP
jgi:dienelactone hydrolase